MDSSLLVVAPLTGLVRPLSEVPDPTFSAEMLGPGIAVLPGKSMATVTVVSPASGIIRTIQPHAFVLQLDPQLALLVHLGIDTYRLKGVFVPQVEANRFVQACDPIISWNLNETIEAGFEPWSCLTLLGAKDSSTELVALKKPGDQVTTGQRLLKILQK